MNELHLKYQQDTGIQVSKQVESLYGVYGSSSIEVQCYECEKTFFHDFKREVNCPNVYDYIKWLEEKITTNEKNKQDNHSKHHHDRKGNR